MLNPETCNFAPKHLYKTRTGQAAKAHCITSTGESRAKKTPRPKISLTNPECRKWGEHMPSWNSQEQAPGILSSPTEFWFLTQRGTTVRLRRTFHSVMHESLDAVTTISSCLLEWRPQILSSWPSNVFTHSFVLIVQSFKRPSEPLLEEKETQQT